MTHLPKEVTSTLTKLKELDLTNETVDSLQTRINETFDLLQRNALLQNDRCSKELDDFIRIVSTHLDLVDTGRSSEVQARDFDQDIREYSGLSSKYKLKVMPKGDSCLLARKYRGPKDSDGESNRIQINWRFNREGRIYLVDCFLFDNKRHPNLIEVEFKGDPYWETAQAQCYELPDTISCMDNRFPSWPSWDFKKQYQHLLNEGHLMAVHLLDNLKNKRIQHLDKKDHEKPLNEIEKDKAAMYMIRNISRKKPAIRESGENGICTVLYSN